MPWEPGQSGNPGGRPKAVKNVEEIARYYTADALHTLAQICVDEAQPAAARVTASVALLDRAWGKPKQEHDLNHRMAASAADDADLIAIALRGGSARNATADDPPILN